MLTVLDVSSNAALTRLDCSYNILTALDVNNNAELRWLECYDNRLTALDISSNKALLALDCSYNPGDGTVFPVTAWFDNSGIPHDFTTGSWSYEGTEITIDYRKAD